MKHAILSQCCGTTTSATCFWTAVFLISYGAAQVLRTVWPQLGQYGDAVLLTALAAACFANFGRNRTLHCGLTAPLFLVGAFVAFLKEAGVWPFDLSFLWGVVAIGVALAFLMEWRATRKAQPAPNA